MPAVERFDCLRADLAQAVAARVERFAATRARAQSSP
jgi:hypothetical protein